MRCKSRADTFQYRWQRSLHGSAVQATLFTPTQKSRPNYIFDLAYTSTSIHNLGLCRSFLVVPRLGEGSCRG